MAKPSVSQSTPILFISTITWGLLLLTDTANAACKRLQIFDRDDGTGNVIPARVFQAPHSFKWDSGSSWPVQAKALRMTEDLGCVKIWTSNDCSGKNQCVCQQNKHVVSSWDKAFTPEVRSISDCGALKSSWIQGTIQVYENNNFGGESIVLDIPFDQCETFRSDQTWKDKVSSMKVTHGCVEFYDRGGCTGNKDVIFKEPNANSNQDGQPANEIRELEAYWDNKVRSFRGCTIDSNSV